MKKIISLILCLAMACCMLVGCSDDEFSNPPYYPEEQTTLERLTLNLYIISGDNMSQNAQVSVKDRIEGYTKTASYNTLLKVHYCKASEYESTVNAAIAQGGENIPHIILINSESFFNSLYASETGNKLLDLTDYVNSTQYGQLNTQIAKSLLASSRIGDKLYTIPNNHIVDEYTYLVVNKQVVHKELHTPTFEINSYKSLEDEKVVELKQTMTEKGYDADKYIYTVKGSYDLKAQLESQGNFCNIIKYPTVTTAEAFSSAFAIVKNPLEQYNDRAMQIIYAINNDLELRNLLQYGVLGANYTVQNNEIVRVKDAQNFYDMNLLYTGNIFNAEFCGEIGWTKAVRDSGQIQNNESVSVK